MNQEREHKTSRAERLADLFRGRPQEWIDGKELARVAGAYAWRTRCSELRRPPFNLNIQNRQRRLRAHGQAIVISEYRYVPPALRPAESAAVWMLTP